MNWNWGAILAWTGVVLNISTAIGYGLKHDVRLSLYYTFAAAITVCVIWR